jgi:hypothetical protein
MAVRPDLAPSGIQDLLQNRHRVPVRGHLVGDQIGRSGAISVEDLLDRRDPLCVYAPVAGAAEAPPVILFGVDRDDEVHAPQCPSAAYLNPLEVFCSSSVIGVRS